jgi:hypothetical protein
MQYGPPPSFSYICVCVYVRTRVHTHKEIIHHLLSKSDITGHRIHIYIHSGTWGQFINEMNTMASGVGNQGLKLHWINPFLFYFFAHPVSPHNRM